MRSSTYCPRPLSRRRSSMRSTGAHEGVCSAGMFHAEFEALAAGPCCAGVATTYVNYGRQASRSGPLLRRALSRIPSRTSKEYPRRYLRRHLLCRRSRAGAGHQASIPESAGPHQPQQSNELDSARRQQSAGFGPLAGASPGRLPPPRPRCGQAAASQHFGGAHPHGQADQEIVAAKTRRNRSGKPIGIGMGGLAVSGAHPSHEAECIPGPPCDLGITALPPATTVKLPDPHRGVVEACGP